MKNKWFFFSLLLLSGLSSCTIYKRQFNSGYYVSLSRKHAPVTGDLHSIHREIERQASNEPLKVHFVKEQDVTRERVLDLSVEKPLHEKKKQPLLKPEALKFFQKEIDHSAMHPDLRTTSKKIGPYDSCGEACGNFVIELIWDMLNPAGKVIFIVILVALVVVVLTM